MLCVVFFVGGVRWVGGRGGVGCEQAAVRQSRTGGELCGISPLQHDALLSRTFDFNRFVVEDGVSACFCWMKLETFG